MSNKEELARLLRLLRLLVDEACDHGMKQASLSNHQNVPSPGAVSDLLNGKRKTMPSWETVWAIVTVCAKHADKNDYTLRAPVDEQTWRRRYDDAQVVGRSEARAGARAEAGNLRHPLDPSSPNTGSAKDLTGIKEVANRVSRRDFALAGAGVLLFGGIGAYVYYADRNDERAEGVEQRERERYSQEFPPPVGDGVKILEAFAGEYTPLWSQALVSPQILGLDEFSYGTGYTDIFDNIFAHGGCWYGRMSLDITVESLRRRVTINRARVNVRSLGSPPGATIFLPLPLGGGEQSETDISHAGINLDAPRPTVRMLSPDMHKASTSEEQARVKNGPIMLMGPFPDSAIVLAAHEVKRLRILAEARTGCYEWEVSLEITADDEPQTIPIKATNYPLRVAAPVREYEMPLREVEYNTADSLGTVHVVTMEELQRWM